MKVQLENLTKQWDDVISVDAINLEIKDGEFVALLGPSGCGKTTTLLMVAGIYQPTWGTIRFDSQVVNHLPPKDRNIGMVFQSYALYPHMTVAQNIGYPLKLKKTPKAEINQSVLQAADKMGIGDLLHRKPFQLSGGQQQRVALGRALVKEPALLLFDEPLSNLDARLRLSMRREIKRLQVELGITTLYVSHDQVEAMTMANRIAVMKDGKIQDYATPDKLYNQPKTIYTAGFIGNPPMNFWQMEISQADGKFQAQGGGIYFTLPPEKGKKAIGADPVTVGIRPEDIIVSDQGVSGEVVSVEPLGRDDLIGVHIGDIEVHALVNPKHNFSEGGSVKLNFNTQRVQFFHSGTKRSLLW